MNNALTTIEHFENGLITLSDSELINFTQQIFTENEEPDTHLTIPTNKEAAINYIKDYCSNFTIIG